MKILPLAVMIALAGCANQEPTPEPVAVAVIESSTASEIPVVLSGAMESPPVETAATGRALILVNEDGTISGVIEAPGIADATAAIEDDAADAAAPAVVMLVPVGDGSWEVPRGTRLTSAQMARYKSGKLSANVRSKAHPRGEVRAQLQGKTQQVKARSSSATSGAASK
jgi:hypothetical protein